MVLNDIYFGLIQAFSYMRLSIWNEKSSILKIDNLFSIRMSPSLAIRTSSSFSFIDSVLMTFFIFLLSEASSFLWCWTHSLISSSSYTSHPSTSSNYSSKSSSFSSHYSSYSTSHWLSLLKISLSSWIIIFITFLLVIILTSLTFVSIALILNIILISIIFSIFSIDNCS